MLELQSPLFSNRDHPVDQNTAGVPSWISRMGCYSPSGNSNGGGLGLDAPKDHIEGAPVLALGDRGDSGPQLAGRSPRPGRIGPDNAVANANPTQSPSELTISREGKPSGPSSPATH
jgi:hypothetical protein